MMLLAYQEAYSGREHSLLDDMHLDSRIRRHGVHVNFAAWIDEKFFKTPKLLHALLWISLAATEGVNNTSQICDYILKIRIRLVLR